MYFLDSAIAIDPLAKSKTARIFRNFDEWVVGYPLELLQSAVLSYEALKKQDKHVKA